jgi:UDP-glucose 4-epimerase
MRILITGVAGFIGSSLADRLVTDGHDVFGVDNLSTGRRNNVNPAVDWFEGERGDIATSDVSFPADIIIHCAASYKDPNNWAEDVYTNILGTTNVIRHAQECGARLLYFQTSLCYGNSPPSPVPLTASLAPESSYAISKTAGESYICHSGIPYVSLRLANIYGPRNLSGPIPTFWKRLSAGEPCTVVDSRRDFVYIDDLVDLVMRVMDSDYVGVLHAASGRDYAIRELYDAVADEFPDAPAVTVTPRGSDDAATILLDPSETEREFGWRAPTSLGAGITRACEWYAGNGVTDTFTHLSLKG